MSRTCGTGGGKEKYKILVRKSEVKKSRGRPRHRWKEVFKLIT
jgi:hypothetical protein